VSEAFAAALHLSRLTLQDFRNYKRLALELAPGAVVLTGENGAGKTNLLEAVSFLSPGRGLRRAPYADVARVGASGFAVHARLETPDGAIEVGTGTIGAGVAAEGPDGEGIVRKVRVNGAPARGADALLDLLRVVWLTPAMDALFTGPAAERRRFLDRLTLAIHPAHGQRALAYEKAMRSRNRLFAEGSRDRAFFEAIETQMAETGTAIAAARVELVRLLEAMVGRLPSDGPFPQSGISLAGILEGEVAGRPAVDVEEDFRRALGDNRERDRQAGRTLDGPHRTDLAVTHKPKAMPAELCSTGEQKALLIGLVLSHARLVGEIAGTVPVLLLDEIAAHLDAGRRAALFGILDELGCQSFMTGTEASLFASLKGRAQFLQVSDGIVQPLPDHVLAGL
jgi:DNA replication and repair protein RecF